MIINDKTYTGNLFKPDGNLLRIVSGHHNPSFRTERQDLPLFIYTDSIQNVPAEFCLTHLFLVLFISTEKNY